MSKLFINKFKDYVNNNYSNNNLKIVDICSNLHCTKSYLHRILINNYGYSIMKYVEYVRILKAIELICKGEKKVYCMVGYKSHPAFYRAFLRVTKLHTRCFSHYQFVDNKNTIRTAINSVTGNPKEAIEIIINDISNKIYTSEVHKKTTKTRKVTIMTKKVTKQITILENL